MAGKVKPIATSNPFFNLVLIFVFAVCLISLIGAVVIALVSAKEMTEAQRIVLKLCVYAFTTTLGALVGLLGGRAGQPQYVGEFPPAEAQASRARGSRTVQPPPPTPS